MQTSSYRNLITAAFLLLFTANLGQTFFLSIFNRELSQLAEISISELGNWYALATLLAGLSMHFAGPLIDHYSNRKIMLLLLAGISLGSTMMALTPVGINLLVIYFLLRFFGQGMASHIAYTSVSRVEHPRAGLALSFIALAMPFGEAILPLTVVFFLGIISWQYLWLGLTLIVASFIGFAIFIFPESGFSMSKPTTTANGTHPASSQKSDFTRNEVLKTTKFWILIISILFPAFAITALFFHQQIWLVAKHLELKQFATGLSLYALTHIFGSLFCGWLIDKTGLTRVFKYYMLPIALAVLSLLMLSGEHALYSFMLLAGITVGASGPVTGILWPKLYGSRHLGAIRGSVTALMVISTAIAPALVGWLYTAGWHSTQILVLLSVYGLVAVVSLMSVNLENKTQ